MSENGNTITPQFSDIQAFTLPPETWMLVQENLSKSELRVTLCILLNQFSVGIDTEPVTFNQLVEQTGMSKSSVLSGIDAAMNRGSVFRTKHNGQPTYQVNIKRGSEKSELMTCHDTYTYSKKTEPILKDDMSCHGEKTELRSEILEKLLKYGLAEHVARNIALTNRYSVELLKRQIEYIEHERESGDAPTSHRKFCGYVVNRIKFDRVAPVGFDQEPEEEIQWLR